MSDRSDGITLYPVERVGNQLFMWAAALAQARRLDCPLYANLAYYRKRRRADRPYGLDSIDHGMVTGDDESADSLLRIGHPDVKAASIWYNKLRPRLLPRLGRVYVAPSALYDPAIDEIETGTTLMGFFQSWRYFDSVADEVRRRMAALNSPSAWCSETAESIGSAEGSIVLNVRRGDYKDPKLQLIHGLATRAYYERALELLGRLGVAGPVFVVSDELDVAMSELHGLADLRPVASPPGTDPLEIIVAISHASGFAMANSSFSWWAAWLGDRPDRPVIGPRPWFTANDGSDRDLLLPQWLTLDAREFPGR